MLASAKSRAKKEGVSFGLTLAHVIIPSLCPILGIPLFFPKENGKFYRGPNTPTIDRINPLNGYVPNNIAIISWRANRLKNNATLMELERIVKFVRARSRK